MINADYAYAVSDAKKFETEVLGMGLNAGMLACNDKGYISPITRELYQAYKNNTLNASYVNSLLEALK